MCESDGDMTAGVFPILRKNDCSTTDYRFTPVIGQPVDSDTTGNPADIDDDQYILVDLGQ